MEVWHLALYGVAAFVALRLLATLMENHRLLKLRDLAEEHQEKLAAERANPKDPAES